MKGSTNPYPSPTRPRAESHDPPLQSLEPFLEAALLGPVAHGDRIGEGERQRVAVAGRGEPAPAHVVLALQQDGVRGVVAVIHRLQVGAELVVVGQVLTEFAERRGDYEQPPAMPVVVPDAPQVANKPTPEIERRARAIVKALYEATDGRPMRWCIVAFIRGDSDEALQYAVDRNWVIRGEGNTACLTDEGRKLITKVFN